MKKSSLQKMLLFPLLLCPSGCAENKYTLTTDRLCAPTIAKETAMAIAENVLAEMHFTIEKFDVEAGLIKTYPLPGAQSFELWRADSVGSFNQAEADLHSIRRTIELNVTDLSRRSAAKTEQAGQLCINCVATTQRLSIAGNGQNYAAPAETLRAIQKLRLNHKQKTNMTWINLGRDTQLETEIIKRIESRLSADKKRLATTKKEQNK
jgi:hypothetical protein